MTRTNIIVSIIILTLGAIGAFAVMNNSRSENNHQSYVIIDGKRVDVDLAVTAEERSGGLSGRQHMNETEGMLFIFEEADLHGFWMRGMNFGLDFIWISGTKIVGVHKDIQPAGEGEELEIYRPAEPADKVLEVNAGWIERNFGDEDIVGKTVEMFVE